MSISQTSTDAERLVKLEEALGCILRNQRVIMEALSVLLMESGTASDESVEELRNRSFWATEQVLKDFPPGEREGDYV